MFKGTLLPAASQARADRKESQRDARMADTVRHLRKVFPSGVYGRITDLAKVPQRR